MLIGKPQQMMIKAAHMMTINNSSQSRYKITSRLFEILRQNAAIAHSKLTKGKPKHSLETKKIMSEKAKGRVSPNKGKAKSLETIQKWKESRKGYKTSPTTIAKILESRKDYKHSDETKKKISIGNLGRIVIVSEETKQKISETLTGIKRKTETKDRIRKSLLGKPKSEDHKKKLRESALKRFALKQIES